MTLSKFSFIAIVVAFLTLASLSSFAQDEAAAVGGAVSGMVFQDTNGNAVREEAETGYAGVAVEILDEEGKFIARVVTGEDGTYRFEGLADGIYFLRFEFSAGFGVRSGGIEVGGESAVVFTPVPFMYPTSSYDFIRLNLSNPASFRGNEVSSFAP